MDSMWWLDPVLIVIFVAVFVSIAIFCIMGQESFRVLRGPTRRLGQGIYNPSLISETQGVVRSDHISGGLVIVGRHMESVVQLIDPTTGRTKVLETPTNMVPGPGWCCGWTMSGVQDSRMFMFRKEPWCIASVIGWKGSDDPQVNTMVLFKVSEPGHLIRLEAPHPGTQKNWAPFVYTTNFGDERLLVEYSLEPHVVLDITPSFNRENKITPHRKYESFGSFSGVEIEYGKFWSNTGRRLTSPPVKTERGWLGIGHRKHNNFNYVHFFYLFDFEPPFNIISYSHEFKIQQPDRIQFCSGMRLKSKDEKIELQYGVNDASAWTTDISLSDVWKMFSIKDK